MSDTMRAVRFHEYGDSSMLLVEEVARPSPKAGQLLVKVRYAGVNPIDWKLRAGLYRDFMPVRFPSTPGREFSGVVENVGSDVRGFSKGQRVYGTANGTYAEYVVVKASNAALIPENISDEEAASIPLGALTAWSVVEDAELKPGQHVLVIGAAGGVGLFLVQFSRLKGATVTGVASTGNLAFIESLGAEAADYTAGPLDAKIEKADAVLDTVGGAALEDAYALVKRGGLLLSIAGMPSEEKAEELGISARSSGNRTSEPLGKITELLAAGKLVTAVEAVFPFSEAAAAQDKSRTRHGRGRILLRIE